MLSQYPTVTDSRTTRDLLVTLMGLAIVAAGFATWQLALAKRDAILSREIQRLDREWNETAAELSEARRLRLGFKAFLDQAGRLGKERASDRWTTALLSVAASAGPEIELRTVHVWRKPEDPSQRVLQIEGIASGSKPRLIANEFLTRLQHELARSSQSSEDCRLEQLDELPPPSLERADQSQATFTITALIRMQSAGNLPEPK